MLKTMKHIAVYGDLKGVVNPYHIQGYLMRMVDEGIVSNLVMYDCGMGVFLISTGLQEKDSFFSKKFGEDPVLLEKLREYENQKIKRIGKMFPIFVVRAEITDEAKLQRAIPGLEKIIAPKMKIDLY